MSRPSKLSAVSCRQLRTSAPTPAASPVKHAPAGSYGQAPPRSFPALQGGGGWRVGGRQAGCWGRGWTAHTTIAPASVHDTSTQTNPPTCHAARGVACRVVTDPAGAYVQQGGVLGAAGWEDLGIVPGWKGGTWKARGQGGCRVDMGAHALWAGRPLEESVGNRGSSGGCSTLRPTHPPSAYCVSDLMAPSSMWVTNRGCS